jgi:hypothetical protein
VTVLLCLREVCRAEQKQQKEPAKTAAAERPAAQSPEGQSAKNAAACADDGFLLVVPLITLRQRHVAAFRRLCLVFYLL